MVAAAPASPQSLAGIIDAATDFFETLKKGLIMNFGRSFRRAGRSVRRASRRVSRTARRVTKQVTQAAKPVTTAVTKVAKPVVDATTRATKAVVSGGLSEVKGALMPNIKIPKAPPLPENNPGAVDPGYVEEGAVAPELGSGNTERSARARKKGTSALRIDKRAGNAGSGGTGLNVPRG